MEFNKHIGQPLFDFKPEGDMTRLEFSLVDYEMFRGCTAVGGPGGSRDLIEGS
jgi:hypothetical protein